MAEPSIPLVEEFSEEEACDSSWWWLGFSIPLLALWGLWVWRRRRLGRRLPEVVAGPSAPAPIELPAASPTEQPLDDLKRIEGIGPKISAMLQASGIQTFAQLAVTEIARLDEILRAANIRRIADPGTWPEQATLAARGDWVALEALQAELKGGRRQ